MNSNSLARVFKTFYGSICVVALTLLSQSIYAQEKPFMKKGVIYIVRHAEKDTGNDPRLTSQGYSRTGELQRTLKSQGYKLDRIYVTKYKRTQLTADSIRIKQKVDTAHYVADANGDGFLNAVLRNKDQNKRILVIGHSNTIPGILKRLGIHDFPADIPDNEYDNLFTVTFHKGKAFLFKRKYGRQSNKAATIGSIKMLQ